MSSRNWLFALILLVATLLVYQPAWNGKPIWDDEIHITTPELRSSHGLTRIWTDPAAAPQYYPLLHTIFWVEYKLWDGWPLPYHLVTILLHATLALLLFQILRRLNVPGAWLGRRFSRSIRSTSNRSRGYPKLRTPFPERSPPRQR